MTPDVNVILVNFPGPEREAVTHNEDDSYTIFINARLSSEAQLQAYEHAMKHIKENDFEKTDAQQIEAIAHGLANQPDAKVMSIDEIERRIKRLQRQRRKIQRQIEVDKERIEFLRENCDMFARAEHNYLYSNDL
ncbi:MAG: hypothetical protein Q4F83_10895 [Eubacteriales bacterium]|nr:hypothetical protein [Eubacteriales bacterium]